MLVLFINYYSFIKLLISFYFYIFSFHLIIIIFIFLCCNALLSFVLLFAIFKYYFVGFIYFYSSFSYSSVSVF